MGEKNEKLKEYRTSDFYLACYLKCIGFKLKALEADGRRYIFVLVGKPVEGNESPAKRFYSGNALVDPVAFKHQIQDLKSVMYDGKDAVKEDSDE